MSEAFVAPAGVVRLTEDWPSNSPTAPHTGNLVRLDARGMAYSRLASGGMQIHNTRLAYEPFPALTWRDFEDLMLFYLAGHARLPNSKPMDTETVLERIACGGSLTAPYGVSHTRLPHHSAKGWPGWSRVFISHTQGGAFDGRGYVIAYKGARSFEGKGFNRAYSFALCDHDVSVGRNARPSRGWHPAHCKRCGLNLSVDSGD